MALNAARSREDRGPTEAEPRGFFAVGGSDERGWREALRGFTLEQREAASRCSACLDGRDLRLAREGLWLCVTGKEPDLAGRLEPACGLAGRDRSGSRAHPAELGGGEGSPHGPSTGEEPGAPSPRPFTLTRLPRFVWDLPRAQALALAEILEARALEPFGTLEESHQEWAVLDEEGKTIVRLEEVSQRFLPAAAGLGDGRDERGLIVHRVRGYDAQFERVMERLAGTPGLTSTADGGIDLRALALETRRRPRRWPPLRAGTRAWSGLGRIVRAELAVLRHERAGLRADEDAEYLHDTRVALRRLRSLLGQMKGVLPHDEQRELVEGLRKLAGCTGPARDLDTLLFELRMAEPDLAADLGPIVTVLEAERARLQVELVAQLDSPRAVELERRLQAAFGARRTGPAGPRADWPFALLIEKRVRRRLRRLRACAARVRARSSPPELHELRIDCKKLRYLLECCRGRVPPKVLEACVAPLKGLQSALGTVQDVEVQGRTLRELALGPAAGAGPAAHLALGRFLERSRERGCRARARYEDQAATFLTDEVRASFGELRTALERGEERAP